MRGFLPPSTDLKLYLVTTKPGFISRWRKVSRPSFDFVARGGGGFWTTGSAVTSITGGGATFAAGGATFSTSYAGGGGALALAGGGSAASTGRGSGASSHAQNMSISVMLTALPAGGISVGGCRRACCPGQIF